MTRWIGFALLSAGFVLFADTVWRFAVQGHGTLAPVARPERFVATGPYRYVRNPMYVGVLGMLLGQALVLGRPVLFGYAVLVWIAVHLFVTVVEEPRLARSFGPGYDRYRANVGRWLPRRRRRRRSRQP
jgi:protein-S-isoprenylcysteine O-methyltransferase Ste14